MSVLVLFHQLHTHAFPMQHVNGRFLPNSYSPERFQPATLWSLASLSKLSAPAVQHNQKDLELPRKVNAGEFHLVGDCREKRKDCEIRPFPMLGRLAESPNRAGHCILVLLINNINSSAVITHKSTIINTVSSECRHSLTSSRFSC